MMTAYPPHATLAQLVSERAALTAREDELERAWLDHHHAGRDAEANVIWLDYEDAKLDRILADVAVRRLRIAQERAESAAA